MRIIVATVLGALLVVACGDQSPPDSDGSPSPAVSTATPSSTPTPTPQCDEKCQLLKSVTPVPTTAPLPQAPGYPEGTRTGVPDLDAILVAIENRDAAGLASLIRLSSEPCEADRPVQPQPLRCPEGTPVGAPLVGFWWTHVEGGLWRASADEVAARILETATARKWRLHSVYSFEMAGRTDDWKPESDFFLTFAAFQPQVGGEFDNVRVAEGRIIALHYAFPEPWAAWENAADPGWLLPRAR